jgi:hypothetical protein
MPKAIDLDDEALQLIARGMYSRDCEAALFEEPNSVVARIGQQRAWEYWLGIAVGVRTDLRGAGRAQGSFSAREYDD